MSNMKKVSFIDTKSRTETIDVEGFEPFEISFIVPNRAKFMTVLHSLPENAVASIYARNENGVNELNGSALLLAYELCKSQITKWTLPAPFSKSAVEEIKDDEIILKMFVTIQASMGLSGN